MPGRAKTPAHLPAQGPILRRPCRLSGCLSGRKGGQDGASERLRRQQHRNDASFLPCPEVEERGPGGAGTSGGGCQGDAVTREAALGPPCRALRGCREERGGSAPLARPARMFIYLCKKVLLGHGGKPRRRGAGGGVGAGRQPWGQAEFSAPHHGVLGGWDRGGLGALRGPPRGAEGTLPGLPPATCGRCCSFGAGGCGRGLCPGSCPECCPALSRRLPPGLGLGLGVSLAFGCLLTNCCPRRLFDIALQLETSSWQGPVCCVVPLACFVPHGACSAHL